MMVTPSSPSVGEWYRTNVTVRTEAEMGALETRKLYEGWCADREIKPASPQLFSQVMKQELKVPTRGKKGRVYYTIAVLGVPKLVKSA